MAYGVVILKCPRTPQSEVWARSYRVLSGAAKNSREYYRRGVDSLPTPKCPGVIQGSPRVVWFVLRPHYEDSHSKGASVKAGLARIARMS